MPKKKRPKSRRKGSAPLRALRLVLVAAVFAALAAIAYLLIVYPGRPMVGPGRSFEFAMDESLEVVSAGLAEEKVVESAFVYAAYHRLVTGSSRLREGRVLLARNLSPEEVLRRITLGRGPVPRRVVIPEGQTRFDIAQLLEEQSICGEAEFLVATSAPPPNVEAPSREGYLFPDTYELREGTSAEDVVARLFANYATRTEAVFEAHSEALASLQEELGMDRHDVLVLASVVEREAGVAAERPIIAGVFLNRLRSGTFRPRHRLQADPTVAYGCLAEPERAPSCEGYEGRISRAMLGDSANRYNTYRHGELPPGPIANPGADAIEAVLSPAPHDYLYFVARGGGRHAFAADLDTHNANVERYLR